MPTSSNVQTCSCSMSQQPGQRQIKVKKPTQWYFTLTFGRDLELVTPLCVATVGVKKKLKFISSFESDGFGPFVRVNLHRKNQRFNMLPVRQMISNFGHPMVVARLHTPRINKLQVVVSSLCFAFRVKFHQETRSTRTSKILIRFALHQTE